MKAYRVFIGCIPGDSQASDLVDMLGQHARVASVKLAMDKNSRDKDYCLGYGFAVCQSKEDMLKLLERANQIQYRGRYITLREYKVGSKLKEDKKRFNLRRLFIGNVPQATAAEELRKIFEKYGDIENIYFVDQSVQQSFKYGYVVFHDESSAIKALNEKINVYIGNSRLRVEQFGGKKTSSQNIAKEQTKAQTNSNFRERTVAFPSVDSLGYQGNESQTQFGTALGPTTSGPAQFQPASRLQPGYFDNMDQAPIVQADGSNYWRKLHFKKNKTFSLESNPIFEAASYRETEKFHPLNNRFDQNSYPAEEYDSLPVNSGGHPPIGNLQTGYDIFRGWGYRTEGQSRGVEANHMQTNLRVNHRRRRGWQGRRF